MRNALYLSGVGITCAFLLLQPLAFSQEDASQQFAAIHSSLLMAANTAIQSADDPERLEMRLQANSQRPLESPVTVSEEHVTKASAERFNALNQLVQPILAKQGVPIQLAAVIQVESAGNPLALSPKGARGLWQLMPDTARRYGLIVDSRVDERLNLEKATSGAARYLRDLYAQFGSWTLALAAYNTGEQNLQRAIDHAHSRDFAMLSALGYIPSETRSYVPAVIAAIGSDLSSTGLVQQSRPSVLFVFAMSEEAFDK